MCVKEKKITREREGGGLRDTMRKTRKYNESKTQCDGETESVKL